MHTFTSCEYVDNCFQLFYNTVVNTSLINACSFFGHRQIEVTDNLIFSITETVENSTHNTVVFGDRFPFLYFVTDYDLEYECAFPGCNSNTEPSISTVTHMIDFVREEDIPVVFYLEFSNGKTAKLIAEDTGAKTMRFSSCHNVTKDEFKQGVSYISLMEQNLEALKEALA